MAKFGINPKGALGVSMPALRELGKEIGQDHKLAAQLWKSGIHEAKILASLIDDPAQVDEKQMDRWARDFDSWDVCDQVCLNLFWKTEYAYKKCYDWPKRKEEFVKRAAFAMIAVYAVHGKEMIDRDFIEFLPAIKNGANDERNYVKKAVSWAIRQIGKRNNKLKKEAIKLSENLLRMDSPSARWIAKDALKELKKQ